MVSWITMQKNACGCVGHRNRMRWQTQPLTKAIASGCIFFVFQIESEAEFFRVTIQYKSLLILWMFNVFLCRKL